MKLKILLISLVALAFLIGLSGCAKDDEEPEPELTNPLGSALIDLPDCISTPDSIMAQQMQRAVEDSVTGAEIYENVRAYIGVADFATAIVRVLMNELAEVTIDYSGSFVGDGGDTFRVNFVTGDHEVYGHTYGFHLDFWNVNNEKLLEFDFSRDPDTKGVLMFRPAMIEPDSIIEDAELFYAKISFDLTMTEYDKWMEVVLVGIPSDDPIENLKLEAYLVGDKLSLFGNSSHIQVSLTDEDCEIPADRNYIFRGMADTTLNLGICEVGIPLSEVITIDNIFEDFAVTEVFDSLLCVCFLPDSTDSSFNTIDSLIDEWISTFTAPGFFTEDGFLQCGPDIPTTPPGFDALTGYSTLEVFMPYDIHTLTLEFVDDGPPVF